MWKDISHYTIDVSHVHNKNHKAHIRLPMAQFSGSHSTININLLKETKRLLLVIPSSLVTSII